MRQQVYCTLFHAWNEGLISNLGGFNTAIFQAYRIADSYNREKLDAAFPYWFVDQSKF